MLNLAAAVLAATLVMPSDSFVLVLDGQCITNGAATNVKAVKSRFTGSYFWFTRGDEEFIVRDRATLQGVRDMHDPLFERATASIAPAMQQLELLGKQLAVMREQLAIGVDPRDGESASVRTRRAQLKDEQNRLARRQNELAQETNRAARAMNELPPETINAEITRALAGLSNDLIARGLARPVR